MLKYFTFNTIIELICFVVALTCLSKDKNSAWRGMVLFLLITCIAEMGGIYIKTAHPDHKLNGHYNIWVYNIFTMFEALFTSLLFMSILKIYTPNYKGIIYGLILLLTLYVYETLDHGIYNKHIITTTVMGVLFVMYSLFYFYYLTKDEAYIDLKFSAEFWWVTGVIFFYFGITVCNLFRQNLSSIYVFPKQSLSYFIYKILNMLIYGFWCYAFICRKCLTTPRH